MGTSDDSAAGFESPSRRPPIRPMIKSAKKNVNAPRKKPSAGKPLRPAKCTASKTSSYATAETSTPAPKPMIKPSVRLLKFSHDAKRPPTMSEDPATKPQKNALPIAPTMRARQTNFKQKRQPVAGAPPSRR